MIMCRWTDGKLLEIGYDGSKAFVMTDAATRRFLDPVTLALV